MLFPKGTILKCTASFENEKSIVCTVKEIDFDFDSEFVNGVLVIGDDGKEFYVDDIDYELAVLKYPTEYYKARDQWYFVVDKVSEDDPIFVSDLLYEQNKWMRTQYSIIKNLPGTMTFAEVGVEYSNFVKENYNHWNSVQDK